MILHNIQIIYKIIQFYKIKNRNYYNKYKNLNKKRKVQ